MYVNRDGPISVSGIFTDNTYPTAVLTDTPEVAGDTIVYLTQKKQDWLAGRYVSCTWDMPEFFSKKDDIIKRDLLKVRLAV